MAANHYYVDPSLSSDTGDGTVGTPWGRASTSAVQYALDTITRNVSPGGDFIHVKSTGTETVPTGGWDLTTYGVPTTGAHLRIVGYTSTALDGGRATIDQNGNALFASNLYNWVTVGYLNVSGKTGSGYAIELDNNCCVYRCSVDGNNDVGGIHADLYSSVIGCEIFNVIGQAINVDRGFVAYNWIDQSSPNEAIRVGLLSVVHNNVIRIGHTSSADSAILLQADQCVAMNNTIYSSVAATASGINAPAGEDNCCIINNYIEGFSGTGGEAIWLDEYCPIILNNRWYNCTSGIVSTNGDAYTAFDENNAALAASGLVDAATGDFRPVTGGTTGARLLREGFPTSLLNEESELATSESLSDIGAIQRPSSSVNHPGMQGRLNG